MKQSLFLIDLQKDFCSKNGNLFVKGAEDDVVRIATLIESQDFDSIHLTMDSHQYLHIAHPIWWNDKDGNQVNPFTPISHQQVLDGEFVARFFPRESLDYLEKLEANGEYKHFVWTYHCIIGSEGAAIMPEITKAIESWQNKTGKMFNVWQKGQYPLSEHFGAMQANVIDTSQPTTQFNTQLHSLLSSNDVVYFGGEAKSHCVANTLKQLIKYAPDLLPKLIILEDCMSDVENFEGLGDKIFTEAINLGSKSIKSTDI